MQKRRSAEIGMEIPAGSASTSRLSPLMIPTWRGEKMIVTRLPYFFLSKRPSFFDLEELASSKRNTCQSNIQNFLATDDKREETKCQSFRTGPKKLQLMGIRKAGYFFASKQIIRELELKPSTKLFRCHFFDTIFSEMIRNSNFWTRRPLDQPRKGFRLGGRSS